MHREEKTGPVRSRFNVLPMLQELQQSVSWEVCAACSPTSTGWVVLFLSKPSISLVALWSSWGRLLFKLDGLVEAAAVFVSGEVCADFCSLLTRAGLEFCLHRLRSK